MRTSVSTSAGLVASGQGRDDPSPRLPKAPLIGWRMMSGGRAPNLASVADLRHTRLTSSGRASLYQALRQLALPAGSQVLVPTYHCPTMVAPVRCAGLEPRFYAIDAEGLPRLDAGLLGPRGRVGAMIVAHYFGIPLDLGAVRAWCDQFGIALIEDCAHSLFGTAGGQPIGTWGDFATASISKFLPVPEMGLLASAKRPLTHAALSPAPVRAQLKGLIDVLEAANAFDRPAGLSSLLRPLFQLKNFRRPPVTNDATHVALTEEQLMKVCDMDRIDQQPLAVSRWIHFGMPLERVVRRRQENFALYAERLRSLQGVRPLGSGSIESAAPYVFPLWVDQGDRVYSALRSAGMPVYRWDRIWPGTPELPGDMGPRWSRHVVQLLCHQDLSVDDVAMVIERVRHTLNA